MPVLSQCLPLFGSKDFHKALKAELLKLPDHCFPLEMTTTQGGYVKENSKDIIILKSERIEQNIIVDLTLFATEIVIGCGCGDDPFDSPAHCDLQMIINKKSGSFSFRNKKLT